MDKNGLKKGISKMSKRLPPDIDIELLQRLQDKQRLKEYKYNLEDFKIDENNNISHPEWKGTKIQGGNSVIESVEIINKYINECEKPYGKRDLSFVHLV